MKKEEFDLTPSFYNSEEVFERFLKNTSYYSGLQKNVKKLISFINPKNILELGSATGETSISLAKDSPNSNVVGVDMRQDIVKVATESAKKSQIVNVRFKQTDMFELAKQKINADFVLMLYSFHHVIDPIENKVTFLKNLYKNMKSGSYLCIAEAFIPENAKNVNDKNSILQTGKIRSEEGFASTFWFSLAGLDKESVVLAEKAGQYCAEKEYLAWELVAKRQDEYLVKSSWLVDTARKAGFKVIINQPTNTIEEKIILLQK